MSELIPKSESSKMLKDKEPQEILDEAAFVHDTGDTYDGSFLVKKKDKIVKMHGLGVYITNEGDIYKGYWEGDKLGVAGDIAVDYNDGAKYRGQIKDYTYNGKGRYTYPDGATITGNFVDNIPVNVLTLRDPNNHAWTGKADVGHCWFEPLNHYYLDYAIPAVEKSVVEGSAKKKGTIIGKGKEKRQIVHGP